MTDVIILVILKSSKKDYKLSKVLLICCKFCKKILVKITIGSNVTEFEFEKTIDGKIMWADNPSHPTYEKQ